MIASRHLLLSMVLLVSSGFSAPPAVSAPAKPFRLCVVDQNLFLTQSDLARKMAAQFQQVRVRAQSRFENDSRTLEADARALESLRSSLPANVVKERSDDIARRRAALQEQGRQINKQLEELDAELTRNAIKLADPMIQAASNELGCSAVIARNSLLHLNDVALDITAAVVKKMKAKPGGS